MLHGEDGTNDGSENTGIDQMRHVYQLIPICFDDEEGIAHPLLRHPFGIGRNGHQPTALSENSPGTVSRVSSDRIKYHIDVSNNCFK